MKRLVSLSRLREAREARALSLDDLAERLDTTRQVISRYETGKAVPRTETFVRLCAVLEVTPAFFTIPPPAAELAPLFFRHFKSKTTRKQLNAVRRKILWLRELVSALESIVVLPNVDIPDFSAPSDPRLISNDQIEAAATALRRAWGLGDGVIVEIVKLVEGKGCIVASGLVESATIDAFSLWTTTGRPLVAINCREVSASHVRFDVAHELGHLVLHRRVDRRFIEMNPETHKLIESQAFRFAGAFLMPESTFRRSVPYVSLDSLLLIKPQWQLSVAAMLHRAQDLNMVERQSAQNLWMNLTRRGWKKAEPLDEAITRDDPKLLKNALLTARDSGDAAIGALSRSLGISRCDYERFAGLSPGELGANSIYDFNPIAFDAQAEPA